MIGTQLMPAYRKLRAFIADEYLPKTPRHLRPRRAAERRGLVRAQRAQQHQALATPAQVHQIGLDEVARIQDGMRRWRRSWGTASPTRSLPELKAFFEWMKARDDMYFKTREELLAAYQTFDARSQPVLPKYFKLRPKTDTRSAWSSHSAKHRPRGPVPGAVTRRQAAGYLLRQHLRPEGAAALGAGVAVAARGGPGHHFQISLQRELTDLPMFRRFSRETAYIEGWGLYAESLGNEIGIYKDR